MYDYSDWKLTRYSINCFSLDHQFWDTEYFFKLIFLYHNFQQNGPVTIFFVLINGHGKQILLSNKVSKHRKNNQNKREQNNN